MDRLRTILHATGEDPYAQVPLDIGDPNAIRLLKILPKFPALSNDSTISCRLHSSTTNDKYTALSYMWGSEEDQKTIKLNGIKFPIRRNLWDFLRQKRIDQQTEGRRMLWIDALCINQAGLAERNHQVAMMGKIYSQASDVLVWLGVQAELMALFRRTDQENWRVTRYDYYPEDLRSFYNHQYWGRAWIFQECVLANSLELQCGPQRINQEPFRARPIQWFDVNNFFLSIFEAREKWHDPAGHSYLDLIGWSHMHSQCLDPRDRIYSRLALIDPRTGITPDYGKTTVELFKEVAEKCLKWDTECVHKLVYLAVTLELDSKNSVANNFERGWDTEIRDWIFQAQIIDHFHLDSASGRGKMSGEGWNDYVEQQPSQLRDWLQTSRIGQQQPNAAHKRLGKVCKLDAEDLL